MARGRRRTSKKEEKPKVVESDSESGGEEYEVERVEKHQIIGKGKNAKLQYYVKWKNYPASDNTWEPVEAVENAHQLVEEYWAANGGEKKRDEVNQQLQGGKASAPTKEKALAKAKASAAVEEEKPESNKRRASSGSAAATPAATKSKRARTEAAETETKAKEAAYESEDEFDVSDSEVENEQFRINQKSWDGVYKVQYVRRDEDDNQLYAIVRWKDSKLAKYKTSTVARKAPLKLIEFYENRLSFQED